MRGPAGARTLADMSTHPAEPSLRESVDELGDRLARIGAAASTLRGLAPRIRHGIPPSDLPRVTEELERHLALASHQVEVVHARAVLELSSIQDAASRR